MPYHDIPFSIDYWQLACKLSSVYPQERRDPSNVFKDAVDELFQGFGNKISWHNFCLYLIGTLHIATDRGKLVPEGGRVAFFLPDGKKMFYVIASRFDLPNDLPIDRPTPF